VVKLVDTQVLGTCGASRGGSSPFARTKTLDHMFGARRHEPAIFNNTYTVSVL
jgi:hypothetical protein